MIKFGFSITVRTENPPINCPKLIRVRVHIHAGDHTNAPDNPVIIPCSLPL
jgi:hypothetical protein